MDNPSISDNEICSTVAGLIKSFNLTDKVDLNLELVDANFWSTEKGLKLGRAGYCGSTGLPGHNSYKAFKHYYMLSLEFLTLDNPSKIVNSLIDKFDLTKGPRGNFITPITVTERHKIQETVYAVIPKIEILESLSILQKNDKNFSIETLVIKDKHAKGIDKYNLNLVDIIKTDGKIAPSNAIATYTDIVPDMSSPAYEVILKMMTQDVMKQISLVSNFLSEISKLTNVSN